MVESEQKPKYEFKHLHGRDVMTSKSGAQIRALADLAAKSAGISWKEVQLMTVKELLEFTGEYAKFEGLNQFEEYDFLAKE